MAPLKPNGDALLAYGSWPPVELANSTSSGYSSSTLSPPSVKRQFSSAYVAARSLRRMGSTKRSRSTPSRSTSASALITTAAVGYAAITAASWPHLWLARSVGASCAWAWRPRARSSVATSVTTGQAGSSAVAAESTTVRECRVRTAPVERSDPRSEASAPAQGRTSSSCAGSTRADPAAASVDRGALRPVRSGPDHRAASARATAKRVTLATTADHAHATAPRGERPASAPCASSSAPPITAPRAASGTAAGTAPSVARSARRPASRAWPGRDRRPARCRSGCARRTACPPASTRRAV